MEDLRTTGENTEINGPTENPSELHFTRVGEVKTKQDPPILEELRQNIAPKIQSGDIQTLPDVINVLNKKEQSGTENPVEEVGNAIRHKYLAPKGRRVLEQLTTHVRAGHTIEELRKKVLQIAEQTGVSRTTITEALENLDTRMTIEELRALTPEEIIALREQYQEYSFLRMDNDISPQLKRVMECLEKINPHSPHRVLPMFIEENQPIFLCELDIPENLLSAITRTNIGEEGIMTVEQLLNTSVKELLGIRGVGTMGIITLAIELQRKAYLDRSHS